jgi:glycosyltransferase involved in cell wall biosynthesis
LNHPSKSPFSRGFPGRLDDPGLPLLTVIIPAYNEARSIAELLDAVAAAPYRRKQIVVVDDASSDGTGAVLDAWRQRTGVDIDLVRHPANRGKGAAIRTGLERARGPICLIQDADLEYDPSDYPALVEPIVSGRADVVYGSRYLRRDNPLPMTANRLCVHLLNLMVRVLYGQAISDEATCYKAFRTEVLRRMDLRCERFEFCPEVTAKASRMGLTIHEVPVRYRPRSILEGKKIRWSDGVEAIATLLRWRVSRMHPSHPAPEAAVGPPRGIADIGVVDPRRAPSAPQG